MKKINWIFIRSTVFIFLLSVVIFSCNDDMQNTVKTQDKVKGKNISSNQIYLSDVYPVSTTNCVVVGDQITATTDNGATWQCQGNVTGNHLNSVFFTNVNTGWVVGASGAIAKTTDFGSNWVIKTSGSSNQLNCVYFIDANTGWTVGNSGTTLLTTNGGENWSSQSIGAGGYKLSSVFFSDSQTGWITAYGSKIFKTTDAGSSWTTVYNVNTTDRLQDIYFINNNTGWAVGFGGSQIAPLIIKTTNSGANWTTTYIAAAEDVLSVCFKDENTGWICLDQSIWNTTDGGANWTGQYSSFSVAEAVNLYKTSGVLRVWAVGDYDHIAKTDDGTNWSRVYGTGIFITLSGTGSSSANVKGDIGGDIYNFTQDNIDPNKYYLPATYPLGKKMQICVCTSSGTGLTTNISTSCYMNLSYRITGACSSGCSPAN